VIEPARAPNDESSLSNLGDPKLVWREHAIRNRVSTIFEFGFHPSIGFTAVVAEKIRDILK